MNTQSLLRSLPKVDEAIKDPVIAAQLEIHPRQLVIDAVRTEIDATRARILSDQLDVVDADVLIAGALVRIERAARRSLRRVINASGIIVHTNLGRSLLSADAAAAVAEVASGYSTLEYDVDTGERGSRHVHCEELICKLTGAEAAMAVNNNAAAVMIGIAALARGGEAVVSRGQLVEIGGSFRIPDIMAESGAHMVEVGTTNKTHGRDYEAAITPNTKLLLKVHSSNFRVVGFTEEVELEELVEIGARHGVPVFEDQGSGVLLDLREYGLPYEPTVGESIARGASLVSCSGDKLLGGPQAGILAGSGPIIRKLKAHPMARALRLDKMTLAALEVTLRSYLDPDKVLREVPTLRMLTTPADQIAARARAMVDIIAPACTGSLDVSVVEDVSRAGGGALPMADIPTFAVRIAPRIASEDEVQTRLRLGDPCIVVRVKDGAVYVDPRTLQAGEDELVARTIADLYCTEA